MRTQKNFLLLFFLSAIYVQTLQAVSIEDLLKGYAESDIELKELSINAQQQILEAQKIGIENGVNVSLSTGTMEFDFSNDLEITPELTLDFPFLNNTSLNVETPLLIGTDVDMTETNISVSTDIITSSAKTRSLNIEKANRNVELAQRALESKTLSVQESFWTSLKSLYTLEANILKTEDDFIEEQLDFELIQAQGFAPQSASYRTQELSVKTAEWTVEEAERLFASELQIFLVDCGFLQNEITTLPSLPTSLTNTELLSIHDFAPSLYTVLDESIWNAEYNEKLWDADVDFELKAEASFERITATSTMAEESNAGLGLNAEWKGFSIGSGVLIPLENPTDPKLTFSFAWDMNTTRLTSLSDEEKIHEANLDLLSIEKAEDSFDQEMQTSFSDALDLEWQKEKNKEELALYEELYNDTQDWYDQGIVSSLDLLQAKTNYEQSLATHNASLIDILIYNIQLEQLFIGE